MTSAVMIFMRRAWPGRRHPASGTTLNRLPLRSEAFSTARQYVQSMDARRDRRLDAVDLVVALAFTLALQVEIWALPAAGFGRFTAAIPAPLGIGKLTLEDGSDVSGFLCEVHAVAGAEDITAHGGWRAYLASR